MSEAQPEAFNWLDERRHMLQKYEGNGHTKSWTGFIYKGVK